MKSCKNCRWFKANEDGEHFNCELLDLDGFIPSIKEDAIGLGKSCTEYEKEKN